MEYLLSSAGRCEFLLALLGLPNVHRYSKASLSEHPAAGSIRAIVGRSRPEDCQKILILRRFAPDTIAPRMGIGPFQLLKHASPDQRRTLLAAALGWMLDA